jgi:putative hemolysin
MSHMLSVTIPHGGLRTLNLEPDVSHTVDNLSCTRMGHLSPSHTVGSEQQLCQKILLHRRWAQNWQTKGNEQKKSPSHTVGSELTEKQALRQEIVSKVGIIWNYLMKK